MGAQTFKNSCFAVNTENRQERMVVIMIELTYLSDIPFVLNDNLIETIENIPETKISLTNGKYILVHESKEIIIEKVIQYNKQIYTNQKRNYRNNSSVQ